MSESTQAAPLKRVVGVAALGLNIVNLTVAAGIFGLPAIIAALLGAQAILAYLVCAALFGLVGLCMAESGSRVGSAGGLYAYARVPFGPIVGGVAGTLLWFASGAVADAAIASLLVDTLAVVSPVFAMPVVRSTTLLAVFAAVMAINIRGVTHGLRLSVTLTVIKIAPLALLVVGGLLFIDPAKLAWTAMPPLRSVGEASVVLFYAFFGFEAALSMSSEIVRPSRTVPWGIFLGLLIIATLYVGLQVVAQGTMGAALAQSKAPLVDVARIMFGTWGGRLMVLAVILSTTGCIAGDLLSTPRVLHAFAQQGQLPRPLGAVHPRYGTPAAAIATYGVICAALSLSGTFQQLSTRASAGTLILYFICCLGVLRLRARGVSTDGPAFRVPFGPLIPVCACAIILWMLWSLSRSELSSNELWTVLAFIGAVGGAYAVNELRRRRGA
jgi:APA family basic amino acid/polyamine antiporter